MTDEILPLLICIEKYHLHDAKGRKCVSGLMKLSKRNPHRNKLGRKQKYFVAMKYYSRCLEVSQNIGIRKCSQL